MWGCVFNFLPCTKINNVGGREWHSKAKLFSAEGCSAPAVLKALIWRQFAATCSTGSLTAENAFIRANGYITAWTGELVWQLFGDSDLPLICRCLLPLSVQRKRGGFAADHYLCSCSSVSWRIFSNIYWKCIEDDVFGKWTYRVPERWLFGELLFIKKMLYLHVRECVLSDFGYIKASSLFEVNSYYHTQTIRVKLGARISKNTISGKRFEKPNL